MMYFLDFDRTLFDNDAFQKYLGTLDVPHDIEEKLRTVYAYARDESLDGGDERKRLWIEIEEWFGTSYDFTDTLAQFVFPDVLEFLAKHGGEAILVTTARVPSFHEAKVRSSGIIGHVFRTVYLPKGEGKSGVISELTREFPPPYCFVDDLVPQLDDVHERCPEVALYEMRRDGGQGSGRYATIRSLSELP